MSKKHHRSEIARPSDSSQRFALVIGNRYQGENLVSGREDAERMAEYLRQLDFIVSGPHYDKRIDEMELLLRQFRDQIVTARDVVFFFSGHGYQIGAENYLLPYGLTIDPANPQLPLSRVLWALMGAPDEAPKVVFLDACRTTENLPAKTTNNQLSGLEGWSRGLAKPGDVPPTTVFSFSASFGEEAPSGKGGQLSPYSQALTESIREPGLELGDLLVRVSESLRWVQTPVDEGFVRLGGKEFYFRPPVRLPFSVNLANDDVVVLLNGELVLTYSEHRGDETSGSHQARVELPLRAGENEIVLLVANGGSYLDGQSWRLTEDWQYEVEIDWPEGTTFEDDNAAPAKTVISAGETGPFKDGPHHGKVFQVARFDIEIDPALGTLKATIDDELWERNSPVWARSQKDLWAQSWAELPLEQSPQISNYLSYLKVIKELLAVFGLLDKISLPDPAEIYAIVRGNAAFERWVQTSMTEQIEDRLRDLETALAKTLGGDGRAFKEFDRSLNESIRALAASEGNQTFSSSDIRVWTAIEQRKGDDR